MKKMRHLLFLLIAVFGFTLFFSTAAHAQGARLSIQGILKKANGQAVDDGDYDLTFKLYADTTGGTALWTENQVGVDVVSGIYTAALGSKTALNIPFNQTYYLGVSVNGSAEMAPRIQLTTAPYALALIGNTNVFPSSGTVRADNLVVVDKLGVDTTAAPSIASMVVAGGIQARGGAPGGSGGNNRGYAFRGYGGDTDSGLFSVADGRVSLYANNTEYIQADAASTRVTIKTNTTIQNSLTVNDQLLVTNASTLGGNLSLTNNAHISYTAGSVTNADWRLVARDDFSSGNVAGWSATSQLIGTTAASVEAYDYGNFNGFVLRPSGTSNTPVLKKQYNLGNVGSYSKVKVVFKYYYTDSWDYDEEMAYAGFATDLNATDPVICWETVATTHSTSSNNAVSYTGDSGWSDQAAVGSMVGSTTSTSFYVFFGMKSNEGTTNERYAVSDIEVWVR